MQLYLSFYNGDQTIIIDMLPDGILRISIGGTGSPDYVEYGGSYFFIDESIVEMTIDKIVSAWPRRDNVAPKTLRFNYIKTTYVMIFDKSPLELVEVMTCDKCDNGDCDDCGLCNRCDQFSDMEEGEKWRNCIFPNVDDDSARKSRCFGIL